MFCQNSFKSSSLRCFEVVFSALETRLYHLLCVSSDFMESATSVRIRHLLEGGCSLARNPLRRLYLSVAWTVLLLKGHVSLDAFGISEDTRSVSY